MGNLWRYELKIGLRNPNPYCIQDLTPIMLKRIFSGAGIFRNLARMAIPGLLMARPSYTFASGGSQDGVGLEHIVFFKSGEKPLPREFTEKFNELRTIPEVQVLAHG